LWSIFPIFRSKTIKAILDSSPRRGEILPFRSRAMSRDHGDFGDSFSPLPASLSQSPTPHNTFVENKGQGAIRPSGHRAVEAHFLRFSLVESDPISALFSRFKCPVGRGSQGFP